ncbi:CARDB domain-containing protein, partial [Myxococcota bacterium]
LGAVCELDMSVYISFDVMNQGSRLAPAGVAITVYIDDTPVETVRTSRALLPGQLEHFSTSWQLPPEMHNVVFTIRVAADDEGDGTGKYNECENGGEDNNSALKNDMLCGIEN